MKKLLFTIAFAALMTGFSSVNAQSTLKIVNRIQLPGEGSWDKVVVDEVNAHVFVSHGKQIHVVDIKTGNANTSIPVSEGIHGIAIANELNKGFISNPHDTSVIVFDLKTLEIVKEFKINGLLTVALLYDPFSQKIFAFNEGSRNANVVDAREYRIIGSIALDGKPSDAVSDSYGRIYVSIRDKNAINVINTMTLQREKRWELAPGESPTGLAYDSKSQRLFTACSNNWLMILDVLSGRIVTRLPIGNLCEGLAFDPEKQLIYCANGEGNITVVQEDANNSFRVIESFPTASGASTIAIDTTTHHLYLPASDNPGAPTEGNSIPENRRPAIQLLDIEPVK